MAFPREKGNSSRLSLANTRALLQLQNRPFVYISELSYLHEEFNFYQHFNV